MGNGDVVADDQRRTERLFLVLVRHVAHREILDVAARADPDVVDVGTNDGVAPHRRLRAKRGVADDLGRRMQVDAVVQLWRNAQIA